MKILIALHDYLPLHKGGSEVHAHQTAGELVRRGHRVHALFTERDLSRAVGEVREGELEGVPTLEVVHQREYADVRETWEEEGSLEVFRAQLARLTPDVVHFHHTALWGPRAVTAAKAAGARVVVTLHDYHALCDAATLMRPDGELCDAATGAPDGSCTACLRRHPVLADRWDGATGEALWERVADERFRFQREHLAAADVVIAPSRFLADRFAAAGFVERADVVVAKAGYPGPLGAPRERGTGSGPLRVGYVGGIYGTKGVHVLVRAFRHLADVPAELHLHGHTDWFPDYVAELEQDAAGLPITFHGPFEPARIDAILGSVDVLVVPSIWVENMPITIQEAFRNGLPVVTTDLGGMRESVQDGVSGLTFPRGDERALAAALRRLAEDPVLYGRLAAGRPHVPTLAEIVDQLEAIYAG